jgi:hypothetical protein
VKYGDTGNVHHNHSATHSSQGKKLEQLENGAHEYDDNGLRTELEILLPNSPFIWESVGVPISTGV